MRKKTSSPAVADRVEVVDAVALAGRDQVDAAFRAFAAAHPLGLPLIDVLQAVGVAGYQGSVDWKKARWPSERRFSTRPKELKGSGAPCTWLIDCRLASPVAGARSDYRRGNRVRRRRVVAVDLGVAFRVVARERGA